MRVENQDGILPPQPEVYQLHRQQSPCQGAGWGFVVSNFGYTIRYTKRCKLLHAAQISLCDFSFMPTRLAFRAAPER